MGLKVKVETFRSRLGLLALSLARNSIEETHPTFSSQLSRLLPFSTPGAGSTSRLSRGAIGGIRLRSCSRTSTPKASGASLLPRPISPQSNRCPRQPQLRPWLRRPSSSRAPSTTCSRSTIPTHSGAPRLTKRTQKLRDDCFRTAKRNGDACMDFFDDRHGQRRKNTAHYTASRARISTTKMAMAMRSMAMRSGPNAPSRSHVSRARTVSSSARTLRTLNFAVAN